MSGISETIILSALKALETPHIALLFGMLGIGLIFAAITKDK